MHGGFISQKSPSRLLMPAELPISLPPTLRTSTSKHSFCSQPQQPLTPCNENQAQTRRNAEAEPCKPGRARSAGERPATAAALPGAVNPELTQPSPQQGFTDVCAAGQNLPHTPNRQKTWDVQSLREISPGSAGISKHFQRR